MTRLLSAALFATTVLAASQAAAAETTVVAVAANFTEPAKEIATAFHEATGDTAKLSFGSTGALYTQIGQGAPFEVFLAADDERPRRAVDEGLAVKGSGFTYAVGTLVLYSTDPKLVGGPDALKTGDFDKIAIANPKTAPYGTAAVETMKKLGVYDDLADKIVQGNSIAQTFQFVSTGNAELGFVALSQVVGDEAGSRWVVPAADHTAIRQDAVLLKTGASNEAAKEFLDFLKGPQAKKIIEKYGYGIGQ
ncbi:molybdate ABC transporter substrate-binding protein [Jiella sonneratiae]|uniref:Molybdate ABC transporter substrate-binding protein n=1 Tax=Jiella sonneratiae TaxID=2816856 RepID=A0ABS3J258_9HYPH|nr:molybdate ABC transporter substrate-binding protein [Jiella sonneratiae]MBO0903053.1 molybdate ABC transporter substrate-binding protein [Jiella sonneratiae]